MNSKHFLLGALVLVSVAAIAPAAQQSGAPEATPSKDLARKQPGQPQDDGERVFKQNCFRCHTAPEGFPPSIAGTIVRHMRVRAGLSQRDEKALLHFFNP
jgi:mono/diheme cytochrome c family protein